MTNTEIIDRIRQLKKEKNAVILAHYYTRPEVQDIADYLGDSLGLSQEAGKTDARIIVFCGVHFMAETAAIISPDKKILIPALGAGCSLAESITGYELREWKKANPDGIIVSYVNTTAEVKAWTDICCTSANALKVVQSFLYRFQRYFFHLSTNGFRMNRNKFFVRIIVFQFMDGFYFCGNDKLLFVRPACMPDHSCRRVHISLRKI